MILVIEDCDEDFATVVEAAHRAAVRNPIRRALSGEEGVRMLRDNSHNRRPAAALVLMDLKTQRGNGRDALQLIKADEDLGVLPVVVLSTSTNPRDLRDCYARGANAYHCKPVDYPSHLDTLNWIFKYWLKSVLLPVAQPYLR